jgi:acyl dehydratase
VADEPSTPGAFDWLSAALGAAAGAGLVLILMAAVTGSGRLRHPRPVNVGSQGTVSS